MGRKRQQSRPGKDNPLPDDQVVGKSETAAIRADVNARLAEIPADTRSLTARVFGDPLPRDPRRHLAPWLNGSGA